MHDAPLISPENKDSVETIVSGLPKIALDLRFAPQSPIESASDLQEIFGEYLARLAADNVAYAEIAFDPQEYAFGADAAIDAATAAAGAQAQAGSGCDARLLLPGTYATSRMGNYVVGAYFAGQPDAEVAQELKENFVPYTVDVRGLEFDEVAATVQAGATRLSHATQLIDDFSADLEGIQPGTASSWIRDRHLAVTFSPLDGEVDELADHPLPLLQQLGFTCSVSPEGNGASASEVFQALNETFGYGLEEFFDLTVKAIEHNFGDQEQRQRLLETVVLPAYEELSDPDLAGPDTEESLAEEAGEDSGLNIELS